MEWLKTNGASAGQELMKNPVGKTIRGLIEKLHAIEETGATALGPAIVTSVCMAAQGKPGSTVVVCTDGLANVGLGAFDEVQTEEDQ